MIVSTVITVALLQMSSPTISHATETVASILSTPATIVAPVAFTRTQSNPERYRRAERLRKAAAEARNSTGNVSSSSSSSDASVSSSVSSQSSSSSSATSDGASSSSAASDTTLPSPLPPANEVRVDNQQGVYLSATSVARREFLEKTIQSIVDAGGTSIVFDVKGGSVLFHSAAPMANEIGLVRSHYDLKEIIALARKHNLYTIGRFVAIKDAGFTSKKPLSRVRHPKTNTVLSQDWIDPANDVAIEYNAQVMCEIAASGIDEVNLDYIRFSTAQVGALRVYSGKQKSDHVEKFIIAMREAINRCGPTTKLGISTYAILGWSYDINVETLGQDVVRFAPYVDVISPMAYPATFTSPEYYIPGKNPGPRNYYLVYRTLKGYAGLLGPEQSKKIRPWIQGYSVVAKDVSDQIRAVYDAGFCGFQVWNAGNNYGQSFKAMTGDRLKPERCGGVVVGSK